MSAAGTRPSGPTVAYVVGARPNYVKMAPVLGAMRERLPEARHLLINTGQHYDPELSALFIEVLGMPEPDVELGVGSGSHALQTARVMERIEPVLTEERPDLIVLPGDVNSTLAAGLVAAKLGIPIVHVEAGLRSFDREMPEEINRLVVDQLADLLLIHSPEARDNLLREGVDASRIAMVGNTMIDALVAVRERYMELDPFSGLGIRRGEYLLATLHRPALVDGDLLGEAVAALAKVADSMPVLFAAHPRTLARLGSFEPPAGFILCGPLGYLDFLAVEAGAAAVLTDSGGVQEETTFLGVPCFTLRDNTERPITVQSGTNTLLGLDPAAITTVPERLRSWAGAGERPEFWDGNAAERAADAICEVLSRRAVQGSDFA